LLRRLYGCAADDRRLAPEKVGCILRRFRCRRAKGGRLDSARPATQRIGPLRNRALLAADPGSDLFAPLMGLFGRHARQPWLAGMPAEQAHQWGEQVAAWVCSQKGAVPQWPDALRRGPC